MPRHKLRALVHPNDRTGAPPLARLFSSTSTTSAPRKLNRGSIAGEKPGERIDDRQNPQLRSGRELIMHKVQAQVLLDRVAGRRSSRSLALTRRLGVLRRN